MKVGIIGAGNIGSHLLNKLVEIGWDVHFVVHGDHIMLHDDDHVFRKTIYRYKDLCKNVNIIFLTIPSTDEYIKDAYLYVIEALETKTKVVTCEKNIPSLFYEDLLPEAHRIGISATVGGGTQLIAHLHGLRVIGFQSIHGIINGTLNLISALQDQGYREKDILEVLKRENCAEPGATTLLDIVNNELTNDVPKKVKILCNILGIGPVLIEDLSPKALSETQLHDMILQEHGMRFFFSIQKPNAVRMGRMVTAFNYETKDIVVQGGYAYLREVSGISGQEDQGFPPIMSTQNAFIINEGERAKTLIIGNGAGPEATCSAMIKDAIMLTKNS